MSVITAIEPADLECKPGEMITLRGGLCVPLIAVKLLLDLEERGVGLRIENGVLIARPRQLLSDADVALLKRHLADVKQLAVYEAPTL